MDFKIFVPSYKRAGGTSTQDYLPDAIFVVDEKEEKAYKKAGIKNVWPVPSSAQGNIARVRNYILDHAPAEFGTENIVMIDDDYSYLGRFNGTKPKKMTGDEAMEFIESIYILAEDADVHLWGLNCMGPDKGSYREMMPFSFKLFVGAPFHAHRGNECRYDERIPLKEDYDMTLQVLHRYRKLLRVNYAFYVNKMHSNIGGCASMRTLEIERQQFELLRRKWGSEIVRVDHGASRDKTRVAKKGYDLNPIIKPPIKGT